MLRKKLDVVDWMAIALLVILAIWFIRMVVYN